MKRIQVVDLVRTFSILSVLAYHLALTHLTSGQTSNWSAWIWERISYNGSLGVSAFFVVSGFLITRLIAQQPLGLLKPDIKRFYVRRIGRIVPLLVTVLLLGAFMIYLATSSTAAFETCFKEKDAVFRISFWISLCTFTFNWYVTLFSAHPYMGLQWDLLWSISIEEQFYLLYPLLLSKVSNKRELCRLLLIFVGLGAVIRFVNIWFYPTVISYNSFQSFDQIALGCLLYLASEKLNGLLEKKWLLNILLCLVGSLLSGAIYFHIPSRPELWWALWNRPLFSFGVFLFLLGGFQISALGSKWLSFLALPGKLSYGMYLLHVWVLYLLWDMFENMNGYEGLALFGLVATVLAWLSYRFFEMPANQAIRHYFGTKG